jgi:hypothetical protein
MMAALQKMESERDQLKRSETAMEDRKKAGYF